MNDEEKIVTNHLPEPALEVAKTADLVLELEEFKIPVHSACLGIHSSVLRDMFQEFQGISTLSKESLAVQEAFSGFEVHDVVFYLAMNYRMENFDFLRTNLDLMSKETAPKGVDLAGVMRIAAKLDAPRILKVGTLLLVALQQMAPASNFR